MAIIDYGVDGCYTAVTSKSANVATFTKAAYREEMGWWHLHVAACCCHAMMMIMMTA